MNTPTRPGLSVQYVQNWSDEMVEPLAQDISLFAMSPRSLRVHLSFYLSDESGRCATVLSQEGLLDISDAGARYCPIGGGKPVSVDFDGALTAEVAASFAREILML